MSLYIFYKVTLSDLRLDLYLIIKLILSRYKLHLVVLDNTSNTKFLLFDNLGLQLLNQPCIELTGKVTDEVCYFTIV